MQVEINVGSAIRCKVEKVGKSLRIVEGSLHDFGWMFVWGHELPQNFLLRIVFSSLFKEFVKEWEKQGLTLEDFKRLLVRFEKDKQKEQKDALLYVLTGDNRMWDFGEEFSYEADEACYIISEELQERYGLSEVEASKLIDSLWDDIGIIKWGTWERIPKTKKKEWLRDFRKIVKMSERWDALFNNLEELRNSLKMEILERYREEIIEQFWRLWKKKGMERKLKESKAN